MFTEVGINFTKNMYEKHSLFVDFLKIIGVDNEIVRLEEAKCIEHHLHPQTKRVVERLIQVRKKSNLNLSKNCKAYRIILKISS